MRKFRSTKPDDILDDERADKRQEKYEAEQRAQVRANKQMGILSNSLHDLGAGAHNCTACLKHLCKASQETSAKAAHLRNIENDRFRTR